MTAAFRPDWANLALTARALSVARGGRALLSGIDLTLHAGSALILQGPNGAGKTTLLRTLAGLQPPFSGALDLPLDCVCYAGHLDGLKSALTVAENLTFWADIYGAAVPGVALARMGLAPLASRRAGDLSAGQKRRLGLARLLVAGRWLWLLDEPTVSLDMTAQSLFAALVGEHLDKGGAAIIATHVDIGLPRAQKLDLSRFRANGPGAGAFDEAFA